MTETRIITAADIEDVVAIHRAAFDGFFLTELGPDFLRLYYRSFSRSGHGVLKGFYEDGILLGFSASAYHSRGFNTKLVRDNFWAFSFFAARFLFRDYRILLRLYRNFSKSTPRQDDDGDYAELLSIGVRPNQQGKGIGKALLLQLEEDVKAKAIFTVSLTTDFHNNDKAVSFYKSLGYDIFYDFVTYPDRKMYRMIRTLK